jgi:DNA polymerase (family X)
MGRVLMGIRFVQQTLRRRPGKTAILHSVMARPDNATVVKALRELAQYLQVEGENAFKTRAYDLASERIAGLSEPIGNRVDAGTLTELNGIGESIAKKITELVTTGKLAALEEFHQRYPPRFLELLDVQEVGPKKAKALWDVLQIGDPDALKKACQEGRLKTVKGFGAKTEEKLLAAVDRWEKSKTKGGGGRHLLAEVMPVAASLLEWMKGAPGVIRFSEGGSLRRRAETVGDVDLIASAADPIPVMDRLAANARVGEVIGRGASKISVRLAGGLQVDLRVLPDEDFATALHHFTGSKAHHIRLRSLALDRGMTISEWGVFKGEEKLKVPTEEALYALLDLQYVPPELREDHGEIDVAAEHKLPTRLLEVSDIAGNVHAHSTWSDGRNSLLEMAQAAHKLGLKWLTVTEHSQTSGYAGGLTEEKLKLSHAEIEAVQAQVPGIKLLKGIESDILDDGRLDYPDKILDQLDVVICSIHQRYGQDEDQMTRRVLNALDNPHFMIWGHPTGRLLLKRDPAPMRMEEILDKAAKKGVAVEVNGCPERLDLKPLHVRQALERGLKLVASTDAHSIAELSTHLPLAVATARKGWARPEDVLNTQSAEAFVSALRHA